MRERAVKNTHRTSLSRREFSRILAVGSAFSVLRETATAGPGFAKPGRTGRQGEASEPSAEAEAQYRVLISRHGARLSDEQKVDVRRLIDQGLKSIATLRLFQLDNADEPANVFQARLRS
jgi:hypothetical protein